MSGACLMAKRYLTELRLSQFRCFGSAEILPDQQPIILTGSNGSGKTSILEAVSLFSPGRGLRRAISEDLARRPENVGWKVTCRIAADGGGETFSSWWKNGPGRRLQIEDRPMRQTDLNRRIKILWLTPQMDRLWIEGADGRRRFLDRIAMSLFPEHPERAVSYEKAMRERNRLLRERIDDESWLGALESQMARSGAEVTRRRRVSLELLENAFAGAASKFPVAGLKLISPPGACADTDDPQQIADALASGRHRDFKAGRTLTGPHRADLHVEFRDRGTAAKLCSTGEQKALLISIVLANARAVSVEFGSPPILLLDEIAAHLDAERLRQLIAEVRQLSSQVWITGTEPALFASIGGDSQFLTVAAGRDGSMVRKN